MDTNKKDEIETEVDKIFDEIISKNKSKSQILTDNKLNEINRDKIPLIQYIITSEEIEELEKNKIIINNNFSPEIANSESQISLKTPLEKIFYAILWKTGSLSYSNSLIEGIKAKDNEELPEKRIVFHQFGRFLTNINEPIIDQHVLRCFLIHKNGCKDEYFEKDLVKNHKDEAKEYIKWVKQIISNHETNLNKFEIDEILFLLGKDIKKKHKTNK